MKEKLMALMKWLHSRVTFEQTRALIAKTCGDMFQNWNGDYDPARLIGYGFVLLCGFVFIALTIYDTLKNHQFNSIAFSTGSVAISGQALAAAWGVKLKQNSEVPMPPPEFRGGQ
jgi:hypothetical protein